MAATGNEVPLLSQLKLLKNWIVNQLASKIDSPVDSIPQDGDILVWQTPGISNGPTIWMDPTLSIPKATSSSDGLMSKEDKAKLDSITVSAVDVVSTTTHKTSYTKDTLEVVCDSTGKVTAMYFIKA